MDFIQFTLCSMNAVIVIDGFLKWFSFAHNEVCRVTVIEPARQQFQTAQILVF